MSNDDLQFTRLRVAMAEQGRRSEGHDHMFVRQQLEASSTRQRPTWPTPMYIGVSVCESSVLVEYVRTFLPKDETAERVNGQVAYTYTVTAS